MALRISIRRMGTRMSTGIRAKGELTMKMRHIKAEQVAREMDRIAGGHYYSAIRTIETDEEDYWLYYIATTNDPPAQYRSFAARAKLEQDAMHNIDAKESMARIANDLRGIRRTDNEDDWEREGRLNEEIDGEWQEMTERQAEEHGVVAAICCRHCAMFDNGNCKMLGCRTHETDTCGKFTR